MKKKIIFQYSGKPEKINFMSIVRSLPNRFVDTVGHFTFIDQVPFTAFETDWLQQEVDKIPQGSFAHPHRGIATLSYIIKGTVEHFDSAGNHGIVKGGGIQWMKAGNGIIHDEVIHPKKGNDISEQLGMQFWINLPAINKAEKPGYMAIQEEDIPEIILDDNKGEIKVLVGRLGRIESKIPTYSKLFLYHLSLNAGSSHTLSINDSQESAVVLLRGQAVVNGTGIPANEMLIFDKEGDDIIIENKSDERIDIIIFGGEPYTETIAFGGPYVMNSQAEIAQANTDYYAGKYGQIDYQNK
ncbi:MAG: pirin family protein [Cyclobacteriaceae bacterium]|nr:pirin family protein [Cyclobacteriaceae bacterium]